MQQFGRSFKRIGAKLINSLAVSVLLFGAPVAQTQAETVPQIPFSPVSQAPAAPLLAPVAAVTLNVPTDVMVGEDFTFTATFANTSGTASDVGYGPFIDIVLPTHGIDGDITADPPEDTDGITFDSATYLGNDLVSTVLTFPDGTGNTCVDHPYAIAPSTGAALQVCGTPGDELVVLQLPFGSFVPGQPPVTVNVNATLSNLADVGTPLAIHARGGYQFGATPLNDWCCSPFDATILSNTSTLGTNWPSSPTTPRLFTITKTYSGPESETATGPNFTRQYTVTVDVAAGQTLTNLDVSDVLPNTMQFAAFISSTPASTALVTPSTTTPGGTLTRRFASITGTTSTADAVMTFSFYIPRSNSGGDILSAITGAPVTSVNAANVQTNWTPIDTRDVGGTIGNTCAVPCHSLTDRSIATQKTVAILTDVSPTGTSPDDVLEYTLNFQVSDFFAFNNLTLTDVLSDGQHFDPSFTPTLILNGNGYTLSTAAFNPANFTEDTSEIGNDTNPATDGSTTLTFRVSDEAVTRGQSANIIGGCINPTTGSNPPDCNTYTNGPTTGTIIFHAIVQHNFTDTYPSGDQSVDHGDILNNALTINGAVLNPTTSAFAPTGSTATDTSSTQLVVAFGALSKTVYAINGTPCEPCTTLINTNGIKPTDTVTYRLQYTQPASDFEATTLTDYVPLPVLSATEVTTFDNTVCGVPAAGVACLGPDDTYHQLTAPVPGAPTLSTNGTANTVSFNYAAYDNDTNETSLIDVLFTVTVNNQPFADGLYLTNEAHVNEGTTNSTSTEGDALVQIKINEPALITTKAAVSTSDPAGVFAPAIGSPIVFNPPGSTASPSWTGGTINSNYLESTPIDSDLSQVDAGDLIRFAIVIHNEGHSQKGAFDISIKDTLQPGYVIPGSGLNVQAFRGDGLAMSFTDLGGGIFGNGIKLVDPGTDTGACQAHDATSGKDTIVITYDLQLDDSITLDQGIINTATLFNYAATSGGPDFTNPLDIIDTATVQPVSAPSKSIVSTSETITSETGTGTNANPRLAAIGEIVRFRIRQGLPEGTVNNIRLHDVMPNGLTFLNDGTARVAFISTGAAVTSNTLSGTGLNITGNETTVDTITPTLVLPDTAVSKTDSTSTANYGANNNDTYVSGDDVYFKLGTVTNPDRDDDSEYVVIEFNAIVSNITGNVAGTNRNNSATARYGSSTTDSSSSPSVRIRVVAPSGTFAKTIITPLPSPLDAGAEVHYQLTYTNATGANISAAEDVHLTDVLPAELTLSTINPHTVTLAGGATGITDASTASSLDVTIGSVPAGGSVTVDYWGTIQSSVTPAEIITNTSNATWSSLPGSGTTSNSTGSVSGTPGSATGERNGSEGPTGTLNNYAATDSQNFTSEGEVTVAKQLMTTSETATTGSDVAIGEVITYGILVTFPEGTTPADTVVDTLPTGLTIVAGSPQVITTGFNGTLSPTTPSVVGNTITFNLANVVVTGDNDTTNNTLLLQFQAQVADILANQAGTTISNEATNQVGTGSVVTTNDVDVNVVEAAITFGKTIVDLPVPPDAGGEVHYRISYVNDGTAANVSTAQDVHITDTLPADLAFRATTPRTIALAGGATGSTDNSSGNNLDITVASVPPGGSVTVDYWAILQDTVTPNEIIANNSNATWTSLTGSVTGERTGAGGVDDYTATSSQEFTTTGSPTMTKALTATSAAHTSGTNVTIGELITYEISVSFPEGTTATDEVVDTLPAGLLVVSGSPEVDTTGFTGGTIGGQSIAVSPDRSQVTFTFTNVKASGDNDTTNDTILLRFQAEVMDVGTNLNDTVLSNEATNQVGSDTPTTSAPVTATVVVPAPVLTKTFTPASGTVNDVILVTLTYQNTGTSNAYDVILTDALNNSKFSNLTPVSTPAGFTFTQTAGVGVTNVQYASNAGVAVTPGATVSFTFNITLTASIVPGELLPNTANVTQTTTLDSSSDDGHDAGERNLTTDASASLTVSSPDLTIDKSHVGNFTLNTNGTFTIAVRNMSTNAATGTITVTDTLPAELTFVSASGTSWTCSHVLQDVTCTRPGPVFGNAILPDISLVVKPNANGSFDNTAVVGITGTDSNLTNNTDTDTVFVGDTAPDLTVVKTHSGTFTVGASGTFTLTVTNLGAAVTAGLITVTDTLPAELDYISATGTGWTCTYNSATRVVTCTNPGPLFPAASLPAISLAVSPNTSTGSPFTNNAVVATSGDTNASNDTTSDSVTVNAGPTSDLTITKTHTGNFTVGVNGTFTLTVSNVGAATTVGPITVTDTLPTELTFASATGTGWTCSNATPVVTCTNPGPLAVGNSLPVITLTVIPNTASGSPFTNNAVVATPGESNLTNNNASDSVIVTAGGAPDLIVTKTHTGNFTVGVNGSFTLTVTNIGTGPTTAAIVVTDPVTVELTVVSAAGTGWNCSATAGQNVSCTRPGPLAVGVSLPAITVTVTPTTVTGSPFLNTATVTTTGDSNNGNNTGNDTVTVDTTPIPDLRIVKSHTGNFTVGTNGLFKITVTNVGSAPATGPITVTDAVPAELTFVSVSGTGWDCSASTGQNVSCTHGNASNLAIGASLADLTLTVIPSTTTGSPFTNTAGVSTASGETNLANNISNDTVNVSAAPGPDLTLVKSHLTNFVVGINGVYTFRVSNVGTVTATGVVTVNDTLQTGLAFVSATSSDAAWDCSTSSGTDVVCTHPGPLAAGASLANLDVTVSVGSPALGSFNNIGTVTTPGDTNGGNNSSTSPTTVTATPEADLEIAKSHTGTFAIGTRGTYTINVRNVGTAATTGGITVTDSLQTGLTFVSATGTNWLCGATGQNVTCNYQMPPATEPASGETLPAITLAVDVGLPALGVFNNVAVVSTPGDNNPANDTAIDRTIVPLTIDLSLTASVNNTTPNVGDTVVFTVTIANAGPNDASNVTVSGITIPGVSIKNVTPSLGTFDQASGIWTVGTLPVSGTQTLVISARVTSSGSTGFTAQVATANEIDIDSTPGNNISSEDDQAKVEIRPVSPSSGNGTVPPILLDPLLAKSPDLQTIQQGETVQFTITAHNPNNVPVTNVVVTDPLPEKISFTGATTTEGTFSYDAASNTVTFNLGTMPANSDVTMTVSGVANEKAQPPDQFRNVAFLTADNDLKAETTTGGLVQIIPAGVIPTTGIGPGPWEFLNLFLLALLAFALPVMSWGTWQWWKRKRTQ